MVDKTPKSKPFKSVVKPNELMTWDNQGRIKRVSYANKRRIFNGRNNMTLDTYRRATNILEEKEGYNVIELPKDAEEHKIIVEVSIGRFPNI